MKRHRQDLSEIVSTLTPVEANWLDDHAADCIRMLRKIPVKKSFTPDDIGELLDSDFRSASTVIRLFLDCSKDEMTMQLKEQLGKGGIGIKRFHEERNTYLNALVNLGVLEKVYTAVHSPLHWSDVLVERLKGGRGSAIKGQQRGRGLEDFTEELLSRIFTKEQIDLRCRFVGATGISTEKADFAIPSRDDPCLLIEAKAYGATGSKQTDILGDLARIVEQKRHDTVLMLITDGITWKERLSDLEKLVEIQNRGLIHRIYTRVMENEFIEDITQLKSEFGL
ncbi:MAG: DpnII family type II restriction endonuclease [Kiritimatiellia bacterium]